MTSLAGGWGELPLQPGTEQQNAALTIEADLALPNLFLDEGWMMQVFGNLLTNGLRYTPEGGKIDLSAEEQDGAGFLYLRRGNTDRNCAPEIE